jgi:hypothetical protein
MIVGLAGKELEAYLSSRYAAVGLLLAWFGLGALLMGGVAFSARPEEIPVWVALSLVSWGLVALPLGFYLRKRKPSQAVWLFANILLGSCFLAAFAILIVGK